MAIVIGVLIGLAIYSSIGLIVFLIQMIFHGFDYLNPILFSLIFLVLAWPLFLLVISVEIFEKIIPKHTTKGAGK